MHSRGHKSPSSARSSKVSLLRSNVFLAFLALLVVTIVVNIPLWMKVLNTHHTVHNGEGTSSVITNGKQPAHTDKVEHDPNPYMATIKGKHAESSGLNRMLHQTFHAADSKEGKAESATHSSSPATPAPTPAPTPPISEADKYEMTANDLLSHELEATPNGAVSTALNDPLGSKVIFKTEKKGAPQASTIAICGTCFDLLPLHLLEVVEELSLASGWAELIIAMRPGTPRSGANEAPLSNVLHPHHPNIIGDVGAKTKLSIEQQLQTLAETHNVHIMVVNIMQGGQPSHRHDLDTLAWSHVLPAVFSHVATTSKHVGFLGPHTIPAHRQNLQHRGVPTLQRMVDKSEKDKVPHIVGVTVVTVETTSTDSPPAAARPKVVSTGFTVQRGNEDQPLLVDRWAGFDALDNRLASDATTGPEVLCPSPYFFVTSRKVLEDHWPHLQDSTPQNVPKIEEKFYVNSAEENAHLHHTMHESYINFVLSAVSSEVRGYFLTPQIDKSQGLPVPSTAVHLPGWTAVGSSPNAGTPLLDFSSSLSTQYNKLLTTFLPGNENSGSTSKTGFLKGVTLKWDTFCLKCFGFSNEVMHFVRPLEGEVLLRSKLGADCFCPGTPRSFSGTLERLATPKTFESDAEDVFNDDKKSNEDDSSKKQATDDVGIFISHKDPGSFPAAGTRFDDGHRPDVVVGRAMYEFTKVPPQWKKHESAVDEIWVPSRFARTVFVNNGFTEAKLFVLPEPIDVFYYDPAVVQPLQLPVRAAQRSWKHASNVLVIEDSTADLSRDTTRDAVAVKGRKKNKAVNTPAKWLPNPLRQGSIADSFRNVKRSEFLSSNHFHFLSVFKWEERKAWDILLKAYFRTFSAEDKVSLHIVAYIYGDSQRSAQAMMSKVRDVLRELQRDEERLDTDDEAGDIKDGAPAKTASKYEWPHVAHIEIISEQLEEDELLSLYRSADGFVLPTRGEGWGLPIIQAMAMGLPTIATNWSGNVDFMTEDTSYLLRVDHLESVPGSTMYGAAKGKYWAQPSQKHLEELMRHVVTNRDAAKAVGERAREHIVAHYSDEVVAEIVKERLTFLRDQFKAHKKETTEKKNVQHALLDDGGHF